MPRGTGLNRMSLNYLDAESLNGSIKERNYQVFVAVKA
ncbi:MAG: hypothetical protein OFPI_42080 [Osedax symbiont Rs2]|nr:MAG: hypothetical protein OFPI_42080 [Osedax symbiont Rs2]